MIDRLLIRQDYGYRMAGCLGDSACGTCARSVWGFEITWLPMDHNGVVLTDPSRDGRTTLQRDIYGLCFEYYETAQATYQMTNGEDIPGY